MRERLAACFDSLQMTACAEGAHLLTCAFVLLDVWHAHRKCVCVSEREVFCLPALHGVWSGESFLL